MITEVSEAVVSDKLNVAIQFITFSSMQG